MDIFDKEMARESIFLDRNVLSPHYLPDHLPYREKEIERIMKILAPALKGKKPNNIFIYGKTGTGKTATVRHVIDRLLQAKERYGSNVDSVYINCRTHNRKYQILLKIAETLYTGENFMGFASTHLYDKILEYIQSTGTIYVVVLDEVDQVKDVDDLLYMLTRANDHLHSGHIAIIGISNNVTFMDKLDPRSKSTLMQEEMVFAPYNAVQLKAILAERVKKAFKPGMCTDSALELAAAYAAQESGDARYALKLLLRAGDIADEKGEPVTDTHVRQARSAVEEDIVLDLISTLPEHPAIVLYAIADLIKEGGKYSKLVGTSHSDEKFLFSGEVYEKYESICKEWGRKPRSARWYREYLKELEMMGLITLTLSGKGIRGNTQLIKLAFPPEKVIAAVKRKFE